MLKRAGLLILCIWISGAFVSGIINNYGLKKECIEDEGFMKGWLFCSRESKHSFALEMAKGMLWPFILVSSLSSADTETLTRDQLGDSHVFMTYVCWASATKLNKREDSTALSAMIGFMRGQDEKMNNNHPQYLALSAQEIVNVESKGELSSFYDYSCSQPVKNVKSAIQQGMLE